MQKNYKQVMQGIGGRQTQRPASSASISKSVPNTNKGKYKKNHTDKSKEDDGITKQRSLLNKLERKLITEIIIHKGEGAYTPSCCHGLGWYKKNVISTYNILY